MSSPYTPSGCTPTTSYPCDACWVKEDGRVRSVFFVLNSFTFTNISNPTEWETNLNCPGNPTGPIYIVPFTQGSMTMTPKESNSFGSVDKEVDSYEVSLTIKDPNILSALPWWNQMSTTHIFYAGFRTQSQIYYAGDGGGNVAEIIPTYSVEDDIQSRVLISVMIKWIQSAGSLMTPHQTPGYTTSNQDGIFGNCLTCN